MTAQPILVVDDDPAILDLIAQVLLEEGYEVLAVSNGQNPDEEFKARQRVRILQREISKR